MIRRDVRPSVTEAAHWHGLDHDSAMCGYCQQELRTMDQDVVYRFSESGIEASDKDLRKKLGGAKLAYFAREPSCIYMTVWNRPRKWWAVQGSNL